jgi:hypothetical protein
MRRHLPPPLAVLPPFGHFLIKPGAMVRHDSQRAYEEVQQLLRLMGRTSAKPQVLNAGTLIGNPAESGRKQAIGYGVVLA